MIAWTYNHKLILKISSAVYHRQESEPSLGSLGKKSPLSILRERSHFHKIFFVKTPKCANETGIEI